jgi:hypothetical protein
MKSEPLAIGERVVVLIDKERKCPGRVEFVGTIAGL